jgi:hexosaminidase
VHATGYDCALMKKTRMLVAAVLSFAFGLAFPGGASPLQAETELPMMPLPAHALKGSGSFLVDGGFQIEFEGHTEPRLVRARDRFFANLSRETGILRWPPASSSQPHFVIRTQGPSAAIEQLGEDESYLLEISPSGVLLSAASPLGILHGLQSFLQLVKTSAQGFVADAVTIEDRPRFAWRGLMIDSGRHFMPLDVIRRALNAMETVKLNVFHWHLSDDQGFRIESRVFPLLQQKGSDGLYYTQDEVRGIIEYARDRGIRVIPEFDMPGHATAWFAGYPALASGKGPYQIERRWGIFDPAMDPTREATYEFLDRFIGEMTALFPDAYFHIGGDECTGKEWLANPRIVQYMSAHSIADAAGLQAYFTGRVQKLVTKHGKITVGWDEVLQPDTPRDVVIQTWRGPDSLAEAVRHGNRGILSAGYYVDLNQSASRHYAVDPLAATVKLTEAQQANILGGEATMWTEYITPENIGGRIWPRTAAIAERLWSPQEINDPASMYLRLGQIERELEYFGEPYRSLREQMLRRMLGDADPSALQVLASVIEPPKGYAREQLGNYDSYSPLNRLVDAVPAESDRAREFREMAARIAAGKPAPLDWQTARSWLTLWRDNDAALQPLLPRSALTAELAPVSHDLATAAAIGLWALDALEKHTPVSSSLRDERIALLKPLEAPRAMLLDMVVPGVEELVRATVQ